jgi:hypothetical protein
MTRSTSSCGTDARNAFASGVPNEDASTSSSIDFRGAGVCGFVWQVHTQ